MITVDTLKTIHSYWQSATWQDYEKLKNSLEHDASVGRVQLFFFNNQILVENMGGECLSHSEVRELLSAILVIWLMRHPEIKSKILGSCLMEKTGTKAAAPDIAVFLGKNLPKYQEGDSRKINLDRDQVPKLVIEVVDTTLDSDLDQKKHLYADLGIPEYWVVDAKSAQVFILVLQGEQYVRFEQSQLISDFTAVLLSQVIEQMQAGSNSSAVSWFNTQLSLYSEESK